MKSDAVKLELLEWLVSTKDEGVLASLMLLKKSTATPDWADNLSVDQMQQINEGLEDIKKGRVISREQLWQKYGRKI
jgi:hypothetical protein